jgi:hypothetical protein
MAWKYYSLKDFVVERTTMRREIFIQNIIEELQKLPPESKIIVDTKTDIKITGFVVQRMDEKNKAKQITELIVPSWSHHRLSPQPHRAFGRMVRADKEPARKKKAASTGSGGSTRAVWKARKGSCGTPFPLCESPTTFFTADLVVPYALLGLSTR